MPEICPQRDAHAGDGATSRGTVRSPVLLLLTLLIVVRSGESRADDPVSIAVGQPMPDFNFAFIAGREPRAVPATQFDLPKAYLAPDAAANDRLHSGDFRTRGPSALERGSSVDASDELPMLHGSSVWQRLAESRSHGRVRLLTLWDTGGSSVSLQAGRKGEPSLQWSSHSTTRNGAARGLFDQLVPGVSRSAHPATHPSSIDALSRPSKAPETAISTTK